MNHWRLRRQLALLYAYMHRNEDAIREARRAVELDPESQDAFHGAITAGNLAMAYALVGEPDQAITLIAYGRNARTLCLFRIFPELPSALPLELR